MNFRHFNGTKLKEIREKQNLSVNEVMRRLLEMGHKKASAQLIRNYENNNNKPGMEYALSLATIMGCEVHEFTDRKGSK